MAEDEITFGKQQEQMFEARRRLQEHRKDPHLTEEELETVRKRAYPENFEGVRSPDYYRTDDLYGTDFVGPIQTTPAEVSQ